MFSFLVIIATAAVIALLAIALKVVGDKTRSARVTQTIIAGLAFVTSIVGVSIAF